jgi:DeoR/GlpR family transcriptional regulator of sugar metabolism
MNKSTGVVALVRLLATDRSFTLEELSNALGISQRTVYRYLRDVTDAGFRITFDNGYRLNPPAPSDGAGRSGVSNVPLQTAIDKLVAHPAVRGDPSMVTMLKEIAEFASRRVEAQPRLLERMRD